MDAQENLGHFQKGVLYLVKKKGSYNFRFLIHVWPKSILTILYKIYEKEKREEIMYGKWLNWTPFFCFGERMSNDLRIGEGIEYSNLGGSCFTASPYLQAF